MKRFLAIITAAIIIISAAGVEAFAEEDKNFVLNGTTMGVVQDDGSILFKPQGSSHANSNALFELLSGNAKRTVVLPKKTFKLDRVLMPGNNKTLIAKGATIIQTDLKPIVLNVSTKLKYKSLKNFTINGGTWKTAKKGSGSKKSSTFRFAHASNIKIKNATVYTDYFCHAIELIACKNVTVDKCRLIAQGKKNPKDDEVLQIDIATSTTAPSEAQYGKKFVKGQTCRNITVKNCYIKGGRGLCTNKNDKINSAITSKHHYNIKVLNNTIIGETYEALCLHNAAGVTVKGNKITSKSTKPGHKYGLFLLSMGKCPNLKKQKNLISGNKVKGVEKGVYIHVVDGSPNKFGKTTFTNNKAYSKAGAKSAISIDSVSKLISKGNKKYKW